MPKRHATYTVTVSRTVTFEMTLTLHARTYEDAQQRALQTIADCPLTWPPVPVPHHPPHAWTITNDTYSAHAVALPQPDAVRARYLVTYGGGPWMTRDQEEALRHVPTEGVGLQEALDTCRACACDAILWHAHHVHAGWVHADGTYRLA